MHNTSVNLCIIMIMYVFNNVPKQYARLMYTYTLNIEENEVGPDSRQVLIKQPVLEIDSF